MKKIALYLAGLLLTASCIYPFEPETPPVDRCLVFEGNLVIGESSTMAVRLLQPLSGSIVTATDTWNINGEARVECTDGTVINGVPRLRGSNEVAFIFNLTNASDKEAYRVWFTDDKTKKVYRSNWMKVEKAPLIERIDFVPDDRNVKVRLTLTGPTDDTRYFCWTYTEDWEIHSDFLPLYLYRYGVDPYNTRGLAYEEIQGEYDKYYCWNRASSKEVFVADTRDLNSRTLPARQIAEFGRTTPRCQELYCISVTAYGISADRYAYIHHMNEVSNIQGDLFSPNPSAMRGNLRCEQDSTELVLGYVGVCQTTMTRAFFEGTRYYTGRVDYSVRFFPNLSEPLEAESNEKGYDYFYMLDNRPLYLVADENGDEKMQWAPRRCVDCTVKGTKNKPSYWPNSHK
ncbi:MAG: DUF4249 family protein [Bacteroidales bacterium]|nr:DUF4249 family protein [Bacteroidales bacterium]